MLHVLCSSFDIRLKRERELRRDIQLVLYVYAVWTYLARSVWPPRQQSSKSLFRGTVLLLIADTDGRTSENVDVASSIRSHRRP